MTLPSKPKYVVRCMTSKKTKRRFHLYLMRRSMRGKFNWSNLLNAHVYDTFEEALREATDLFVHGFQIVPVGYAGPPYWQNREHVKHEGSMAQYRNPRVFLIDPISGQQIEV